MAVESLVITTPSTAVEPSAGLAWTGLAAGAGVFWAMAKPGGKSIAVATSNDFRRKTLSPDRRPGRDRPTTCITGVNDYKCKSLSLFSM
jgi:hypothetical protein